MGKIIIKKYVTSQKIKTSSIFQNKSNYKKSNGQENKTFKWEKIIRKKIHFWKFQLTKI